MYIALSLKASKMVRKIAVYCSFIDPERMKGWVGLDG